MTTYSNSTCGTCRHWHEHRNDESLLVSAERVGECRLHPLCFPMPTPSGVALVPAYAPLPSTFPACSHHEVFPHD